jgi:hypothetical protein
VRAALGCGLGHPDVILYALGLLWSINERLGGNKGRTFPPLSRQWFEDLLWFYQEKLQRESKR